MTRALGAPVGGARPVLMDEHPHVCPRGTGIAERDIIAFVWYEGSRDIFGERHRPAPYADAERERLREHLYRDRARDYYRRLAKIEGLSRDEVLAVTGDVDIAEPGTRCHPCVRLERYYHRMLVELFPQDAPQFGRPELRRLAATYMKRDPAFAAFVEQEGGVDQAVDRLYDRLGLERPPHPPGPGRRDREAE